MSYYYTYYVGYEQEGKVYPLGPYDRFGKLHDILSRSSSFASNIHYEFAPVKEEEISDELRKQFEYEDWHGKKVVDIKKCNLDELPTGSYIKTGYFLIEDVMEYEKEHNSEDLFYDTVTPTVYASMVTSEHLFGKPTPKKDVEGNEFEVHSASEYMYYAYPDYNTEEYEAFLMRRAAEVYEYGIPKDAHIVILLSEG